MGASDARGESRRAARRACSRASRGGLPSLRPLCARRCVGRSLRAAARAPVQACSLPSGGRAHLAHSQHAEESGLEREPDDVRWDDSRDIATFDYYEEDGVRIYSYRLEAGIGGELKGDVMFIYNESGTVRYACLLADDAATELVQSLRVRAGPIPERPERN